MLGTYLELVICAFENYATDDVITQTNISVTQYIQAVSMSLRRYAESLAKKSIRIGEF